MENLPVVLQNLMVSFITFLPKLAVAIVILVITLYAAGLAGRLIRKGLAARKVNEQVSRLLLQFARWAILNDYPSFVRFHTFGGSSIDLTVYFWVDSTEIHPMDAKDAGMMRVNAAFEKARISIPFPTQVVLLQQNDEKQVKPGI